MDKNKMNTGSKDSFSQKAGDKIERVGEKIRDAGATKAGKMVYDAGNKIEHMKDNKNKV